MSSLSSHSSMYDQLSHPDCDSRPSCQGEDVHLEEADPLSELDWSAHQRYSFSQAHGTVVEISSFLRG